jgi:hypothetical protein
MTTLEEASARLEALAFARRLADELALEDGFSLGEVYAINLTQSSTRHITEYWVHGEGAQTKIHWGVKGSMQRCIRHLRTKVRDPGGLCAEYHRLATGEWPTEHGKAGIPS